MKNRERFSALMGLQIAATTVLDFVNGELGAWRAREELIPDPPTVVPEQVSSSGRAVTLEEMELTVRAYNALKLLEVKTAGELAAWDVSDLKKVRNVGTKTIQELRLVLKSLGLSFRKDFDAEYAYQDNPAPQPAEPRPKPQGPVCHVCGGTATKKGGWYVVQPCLRDGLQCAWKLNWGPPLPKEAA